ncbi:MAG: right-handed parallel beta-helix repeat-containing protein [Planctomycetaceae bacterium]|nr:right-handed parallel beta-helix repeat-containing protein [Planctomycetaceae bacterium]
MLQHALIALCLAVPGASADNSTAAGKFTVEHPTLHNLGFEWAIIGDANRNATVAASFRKVGDPEWREALPLLRIGGERVYRVRENLDYTVPDGFAGSILNLEPGTEYECRFELADPEGTSGESSHTVTVKTRSEPQPFAGGRVLHVYSPEYDGERLEPSFTSLLQAYYGAGLGDWSVVWERRAQPGDTILMHAGLYQSERRNYVDPQMTPFDGTMSLTLKGTAEKPITIKAAGDGEVVIDGDGNHRLFDVMASHHHIFDGLTIRNTDVGIFAGQKEVLGAVGLTVKNCRFENVGFGVWTEYAGSSDFYIADNLFLGRDDRFRLIGWTGPLWASAGPYGSHQLTSYYAIKVYGPGHVIANNAIAYFHDGIGISTYGTPPDDPELQASSIDICNNDFHMLNDDFVETDGAAHNVRVLNNRGINAAHGGYSAQPAFGGPVYFIGNLLYHVPSGVAFKFSAKPAGLLVFHNTIIGEQTLREPSSNMHFRNNLFLGRDTPDRGIMTWGNASAACSSDYNGYRPNSGVAGQYVWFRPPAGSINYEPQESDWQTFATLDEFRTATGQEAHGIEVDFDCLENLMPPDPNGRHAVYHAMDLNFRLNPSGKAVDAGVPLPTVNENYTGSAPDLGALEIGQAQPTYGPRWLKAQPFYR